MRDYHNYNYNIIKRSIRIYYIFQLVVLITWILSLLFKYLHVIPETENSYAVLDKFCKNVGLADHIFHFVIHWVKYIGFSNQVLVAFAVIYMKKEEDILDNCNKLDFLLKASIF